MRSRAIRVPRSEGEEARRALVHAGKLRTDLRIRVDGSDVVLPVGPGALPVRGSVAEEEFLPLSDRGPARRYQDLVSLPPDRRALLPRAFDVIGDIVLVRIPRELEPDAHAIGDALLRFVPGARLVGVDMGVHGPDRRRSLRRVAGTGSWKTQHRENGISIEVDVERAYFSPRLAREHARVAGAVCRGETVYDLCCGVGPFALAIARDGRATGVAAVDQNPDALELLRTSLGRLAPRIPVEVVQDDVERFLARAEPADRAILNLPLQGIKYLPSVARAVRPGGSIHYYEVVERAELDTRAMTILERTGERSDWSIRESREVHAYSPTSDLRAYTLERRGAA